MDTNSRITIHRNGRVSRGTEDLYVPGSSTYESFHQDEQTPNILLFSRRGTGKSTAVRWELHRRCLKYPGYRYAVVRNSKPELERTHLQYLDRELDTLGGEYASVKAQALYENGSIGIFGGFEREKDALKMIGADLDALVVEECTTVSWPLIIDLASNLRTTKATGRVPQLICPTNPYGPYALPVKRHWITQDITDAEEPGYNPADWRAIRTTAEDNPHLDFNQYDRRLGALSPAKRLAWLIGEWSTSESGAYFADFQPERDGREWHVISRLPVFPAGTMFFRGLDWGFAPDPAACEWLAVLPNRRIIVFHEGQWLRTTAAEVADEVIGHTRGRPIAQSWIDPTAFNNERATGYSVASMMESRGLPLTASINDRAAAGTVIHEALGTILPDGLPRIQIWREGAPNLIRTLPLMQSNPNHPDRIKDGEDHWVLALAYALLGMFDISPSELKEDKMPFWMQRPAGDARPLGSESVRDRR